MLDTLNATDTGMGRKARCWGAVLFCSLSLAYVFHLLTFGDFGIMIFMMPSCIVCSVYVPFVRIYAFTIVIKTCLSPADRHTAAGVS